MIPFPGESVGLSDAYAVVAGDFGPSVYDGLWSRQGSLTLDPVEEWRGYVYPGEPTYLEAPEAVTVSWVVEVAGGAGTLSAAWGFDPDYGDPTLTPSTSLGTHSISGATTLVLPTTLTAADVLTGDDAMMVQLVGVSGAIDVQQVKMRVWPTAGVAGGWSDVYPSFNGLAQNAAVATWGDSLLGDATDTDPEAAWDAGFAEFLGLVGDGAATREFSFTAGDPVMGADQTLSKITLVDYSAVHVLYRGMYMIHGVDPTIAFPIDGLALTEGVDWIRPPTEVADDFTAITQPTGAASVGWIGATITVDALPDTLPGGALVHAEAGEWTDESAPAGPAEYTVTFSYGAPASDGVPLALPTDGRMILVSVTHAMALGGTAATWPGWVPSAIAPITRQELITATLPTIQSYPVLPPYRVWDPNATVTFMRVMQRGDGRGMGSGRVFNQGTRQGSNKVFGTY